MEAAFTTAMMRIAELAIPRQERRRPGQGWRGDDQTEVEFQAATDAIHAAWQRLKMDTRNALLGRAVRHAYNWTKRVRSEPTVVRFFERHVVGLEKKLRMGNQLGFFQNIKSMQLKDTKRVESQYVRDEEGTLLRLVGRIHERWARLFRSLLNAKYDIIDPDIPERLLHQSVASAFGTEPTEGEVASAMKTMADAKAVRLVGLPVELLKLGLYQDRTVFLEFDRLTTLIWGEEESNDSGKTRSLLYSTRRAPRQNAENTAASRSCHTRVRRSLKW